MQIEPSIFKAYDIRGTYPDQIDSSVAYAIGKAYGQFLKPNKVVVGRDVRTSGPELEKALIAGLESENIEVMQIGQITTEQIYFAVGFYGFDGGICVSASHNPREYNGFKLTREKAIPISSDTGINEIRDLASLVEIPTVIPEPKNIKELDIVAEYFQFLKEKFILKPIQPFKIVANGNFGMQAEMLKKLVTVHSLPLEVIYLNDQPNGEFPKGRPDPMIPSNREETSSLVVLSGADFGVAWDADADRCFFYDGQGNYIDPYYINALLIEYIFVNMPGERVYHDPRLKWAILDIAKKYKGEVIFDKSGHAFIKARMRKDNLYFGSEVTAHYFFRDFYFADNGLIPLLWLLQIITEKKKSLGELVKEFTKNYPKVNEMLFKVTSVSEVVTALTDEYKDGIAETIDGISYEFPSTQGGQAWRFNARGSNTEPLLKINLEAKSKAIVEQKVAEIEAFVTSLGGTEVDN